MLVDKLTATYMSLTECLLSIITLFSGAFAGWEGVLVSQALVRCDWIHLGDEQSEIIVTSLGHLPCAWSLHFMLLRLYCHAECASACLLPDFSRVTHSRVERDFVWLPRPCVLDWCGRWCLNVICQVVVTSLYFFLLSFSFLPGAFKDLNVE